MWYLTQLQSRIINFECLMIFYCASITIVYYTICAIVCTHNYRLTYYRKRWVIMFLRLQCSVGISRLLLHRLEYSCYIYIMDIRIL